MPIRKIRIGCLLASVFVLSFLRPNFTDEALARPVHQLIRDGKNQSQSKSERVEGSRQRALGRGSGSAPPSQALQHLDAKQIPVDPTPALVHREENQGQRFGLPSLRHTFTPVPHPLTRRDQRPPVRNSIGVSLPNDANSRIALPASYSRPVVPGSLPVERGATSRIGSLNPRPVAPGGPARGAVSLPTTRRTAAISGTGIMHRGIGPSQIGGPAHLTR
jgi:hypothetical protein